MNRKKLLINENPELIAGIILSLPELIRIATKVFHAIKKIFLRKEKVHKLDKFGKETINAEEKIINFADKLHHKYIKILSKLISPFLPKNTSNRITIQVARILYHLVIAYLLYTSGIEFLESFAESNLNGSMIESFMIGIKTKEIGKFVKQYLTHLIH